MKTLRYRGTDLRVKYECPHWFPLAKDGLWLIPDGDYNTLYFIDDLDVVIEISEMKEGLCEAVSKVTDFGELVEIVDCVEWQEQCSDSCFFFENGRIYPHDKPIDSNDMVLPQHVGFYRWERDREEADLLYQSFPTFDYLFLPVPIECKIRVPNASEKLWMHCAAQMPLYRDQVIETEKEKRRRNLERDNIRLRATAAKTLEDAVNSIISAFPDMPIPVLHAGMMHARGVTWEEIVKKVGCSKSTASGYIQRFYELTSWPKSDRRAGMGKKYHLDEARDRSAEHSEHTRTRP